MHRTLATIIAVLLGATSCSGADAEQVGTGRAAPSPATASVTTSVAAPTITVPGTASSDDHWVAPSTALLTTDDVTDPWDLTGGHEHDGHDPGPNQTDCDTYWALEQVAAQPVSSRLWFQPGANLDHDVFDAGEATALQVMAAAGSLASDCPLVRWTEGGSMTVTDLPATTDGVTTIEVTSDVGEVEWLAWARRSNVVSRLRYVHFGTTPGDPPPHGAFEEFEQLIRFMKRRLDGATPASLTTPTTTRAPSMPAESLAPAGPPSDSPPVNGHPLDPALLALSELSPGLHLAPMISYEPGDAAQQRLAGCEASEAMVLLDGWFRLEQVLEQDDGPGGAQIVGRAPTAAQAAVAVEQFGLIASCDPNLDDVFDGAAFSGGHLGPVGSGTASVLSAEDPATAGVLIVAYQVDDVVGALMVAGHDAPPTVEDHHSMLVTAIERAATI